MGWCLVIRIGQRGVRPSVIRAQRGPPKIEYVRAQGIESRRRLYATATATGGRLAVDCFCGGGTKDRDRSLLSQNAKLDPAQLFSKLQQQNSKAEGSQISI